jgi:uncharacterized protein
MLHDVGAFAPYAVEGMDHALRSTQVVEPILRRAGFPSDQVDAVKGAILTHSYYCPDAPASIEARVLHDADTIDFLGSTGVMRILSIVGREKITPNVSSAYALLTNFEGTLVDKVTPGTYARKLAAQRGVELKTFLDSVHAENFGLPTP